MREHRFGIGAIHNMTAYSMFGQGKRLGKTYKTAADDYDIRFFRHIRLMAQLVTGLKGGFCP